MSPGRWKGSRDRRKPRQDKARLVLGNLITIPKGEHMGKSTTIIQIVKNKVILRINENETIIVKKSEL